MHKVARLAGPSHNVCFTQDHTPRRERRNVVLVPEYDLDQLEKFFALPMHQQIRHFKVSIKKRLNEGSNVHPKGLYLVEASKALDIAESLTFAYFTNDLMVEEIV